MSLWNDTYGPRFDAAVRGELTSTDGPNNGFESTFPHID